MADLKLSELLKLNNFHFNKNLGQNFIDDTNLLDSIVADAKIDENDVVVEIGAGAGTLTSRLAKVAKKVYAFEVDNNLKKVLDYTLRGVQNVEVCFMDVLKMSDEELTNIVGENFKVVANLPYYITTPLVMRFLESNLPVESLTIMVQKEVADRFTAKMGGKEYAAITLAIQLMGDAKVTRNVGRKCFYPMPNVDSAVVNIKLNRQKFPDANVPLTKKLIRSAFNMRRKTLSNNLCASFALNKEQSDNLLTAAGFNTMIRGEALSITDFIHLADTMQDIK